MKKLLIVLLAAFTAYQASGQETFGVAYTTNDELSEFEKELLEIIEVAYMKVRFTGDLENKRIFVDEVVCNDGEFSHNTLYTDLYILTGVDNMSIFIKPVSRDSISVRLRFKGDNCGGQIGRTLALRNDKYFTQMETGVKELMKNEANVLRGTIFYPMGMDVPVMAYTTGIWTEKDFGDGEIWTGFDLCGLRDAMVHPREWYEKFGIKNYIYYTVRFE